MTLTAALSRFKKERILVMGDIMVDRFIRGSVDRLSPEAPVPVVEVKTETYSPGGAGNVAANIAALGGRAALVGLIGRDTVGDKLRGDFARLGIEPFLIAHPDRPTTLKTRVIAGHQQVVRFDREEARALPAAEEKELLARYAAQLPRCDAVILSDYGKGCLTPRMISETIARARAKRKPIFVDPKVEHFKRYLRVTCVTPNLYEACAGMAGTGHPKAPGGAKDGWAGLPRDERELDDLGKRIRKALCCEAVLITRGEHGMSLFRASKVSHIPAQAREVFDVTGAGDTVIAALALAHATGLDLLSAARAANLAAGIVVGKLGTATVSPKELSAAIAQANA